MSGETGWGRGGEVIQHTEKFHFLPCTEKRVSAGENLAERWEIYPANIDNHLFIS